MVTSTEYSDIQQFYARQMQLLDCGHTEEWASTFAEDGTFTVGDSTTKGRGAISGAAAAVSKDFAERGVSRRHWLGMLIADTAGQGVHVQAYALVIETPSGNGDPHVTRSTTFDDQLVRQAASWEVVQRVVLRDGLDG